MSICGSLFFRYIYCEDLMPFTDNILVTGGAGFIGSNLVDGLIAAGAKVTVIDNFVTGFRENLEEISGDFDLVEGDINDSATLKKAVAGKQIIFHEAALPSVPRSVDDPAETHRACVDGTFNLLLEAKNAGVKRVVYAASSSAYGDQPTLPKAEDMRPDPLSPYAAAKLVGEYYCRVFSHVYGLETVCLRYFNVFGPRQNPSSAYSGVISRFIDAVMRNERPTIYGDGEQSRDFTFIANVVDANIKAAQTSSGIGTVMNCANGERITLNELLKAVCSAAGRPEIQAIYEAARKGDVKHSQADNTLAIEHLGYKKLVGLDEGLRRTIEWWANSRFNTAK